MASRGDGFKLKTERSTSPLLTRLLIATCVIGVLVGALGLGLPRLVGSRDEFGAERQAVITRASDFAVTFNTYAVADKRDYQRRVKQLMTPAYFRDFVKITNVMFDAIENREQSSGDAKVLAIAVDTIDEDSATVLVAVNAAVRRGDSAKSVARRFRWSVSMSKADGKWWVNQFDAVPTMQATLGDVTENEQGGGEE